MHSKMKSSVSFNASPSHLKPSAQLFCNRKENRHKCPVWLITVWPFPYYGSAYCNYFLCTVYQRRCSSLSPPPFVCYCFFAFPFLPLPLSPLFFFPLQPVRCSLAPDPPTRRSPLSVSGGMQMIVIRDVGCDAWNYISETELWWSECAWVCPTPPQRGMRPQLGGALWSYLTQTLSIVCSLPVRAFITPITWQLASNCHRP